MMEQLCKLFPVLQLALREAILPGSSQRLHKADVAALLALQRLASSCRVLSRLFAEQKRWLMWTLQRWPHRHVKVRKPKRLVMLGKNLRLGDVVKVTPDMHRGDRVLVDRSFVGTLVNFTPTRRFLTFHVQKTSRGRATDYTEKVLFSTIREMSLVW